MMDLSNDSPLEFNEESLLGMSSFLIGMSLRPGVDPQDSAMLRKAGLFIRNQVVVAQNKRVEILNILTQ